MSAVDYAEFADDIYVPHDRPMRTASAGMTIPAAWWLLPSIVVGAFIWFKLIASVLL